MAALTNLLFVLTFGLTATTEVDLQKRVINGRDCLDHERPYEVKFQYPSGSLICGGSLISDRWILTAAHCWENGMIAVVSPHPGPGQQVLFVANYTLGNVDLMLVELQQPTTNIQHIPLPDCVNWPLQSGDVVQMAGYGRYRVDPQNKKVPGASPVLQCADFTVIGQSMVTSMPSGRTSICFDVDTNHVDLSPGDSGGGVVFNNAIYGVVQGANKVYAHVDPAAFVDICQYMTWITSITGLTP